MIKTIQFNSQRLGKLFLDFTNDKGVPYDVVVFAGENGCGKTSILDSLLNLFKNYTMGDIDFITYSLNGHQIKLMNKKDSPIEHFSVGGGPQNAPIALNVANDTLKYNICKNGFAYSKARSGFKLNDISSISAKDIDTNKNDFDNDDYTDVKQLLIDINSIDTANFYEFSKTHQELTGSQIIDEFNKTSRIARFKNAFNSFFKTIKFEKIGNPVNNSYPILFKKYNKHIDINNLSTGEKQIVCRGGRLLKNVGTMNDAIVLIDEPELSLHPIWQSKILEYYCNLFKNSDKQVAQLFIATHSEYVIESALKKANCLVIVLKDAFGVAEAERIAAPDIFASIISSEVKYKAFNIYSVDYHDALYAHYQHITSTTSSIEDTDKMILNSDCFDKAKYIKNDSYKGRKYCTLPTYIRNAVHHPDSNRSFTYEELKESIELLRRLCKE